MNAKGGNEGWNEGYHEGRYSLFFEENYWTYNVGNHQLNDIFNSTLKAKSIHPRNKQPYGWNNYYLREKTWNARMKKSLPELSLIIKKLHRISF